MPSVAFLLLALMAAAVPARAGENKEKPFVLVLDPGHGGKDYGCIGRITNEKTIVLDVAKSGRACSQVLRR